MKKLVLVLLLATVLAGGVFAQSGISAGIGGTFTADFVNLAWTKNGRDVVQAAAPHFPEDYFNQYIVGGAFFAYVDATYVMFSLGMGFYNISPANKALKSLFDDEKIRQILTTFDLSLYGKYPISLGPATIFPMLGIDCKFALAKDIKVNGTKYAYGSINGTTFSNDVVGGFDDGFISWANNDEGTVGEYWTTLWVKFGVGGDIPIGDKFYVRPMILYGFGTVPKALKETLDGMGWTSPLKIADIILHGADVKVAFGIKF